MFHTLSKTKANYYFQEKQLSSNKIRNLAHDIKMQHKKAYTNYKFCPQNLADEISVADENYLETNVPDYITLVLNSDMKDTINNDLVQHYYLNNESESFNKDLSLENINMENRDLNLNSLLNLDEDTKSNEESLNHVPTNTIEKLKLNESLVLSTNLDDIMKPNEESFRHDLNQNLNSESENIANEQNLENTFMEYGVNSILEYPLNSFSVNSECLINESESNPFINETLFQNYTNDADCSLKSNSSHSSYTNNMIIFLPASNLFIREIIFLQDNGNSALTLVNMQDNLILASDDFFFFKQ